MSEPQTVRLAANAQVPEIAPGRYFYVVSCTAPFKLETNNRTGNRTMNTGHKFFEAEGFKRLIFREINGSANVVEFVAGDTAYEGAVPVTEIDTFDYPYLMDDDGSLLGVPDSDYTDLPERITVSGVSYTRKTFHIANKGNNQVGIYKASGELVDLIFSNESRLLTLSGELKMKGIGGGANIALYYTLING